MAEAAAGAVVEEVVKCAVPPIKRGFNYLCCFTSNINNLKDEAKELEVAEKGINMKVETALNAGRVKDPTVDNWLAESKKIRDEKTAILNEVPNVGSVCLNLGARFSLSKRATKTTDRMKELRVECSKFGDVSLAGPPAASKPVQLGKTYEFESRKQIEEDIMAVLKGGDVSMIGICGMGGLGKTTMAKRIMNRVLQEHVFEEAVFAVVSQPIDKPKIRLDIGGQLGLKLQDEPSETVRIQKLHERLSGTKRILLVLDDVWEGIELEEFGIPRDSKGCTSLITSRNSDALRAMDVKKEFGMKILSQDEARFLFREKAGTCMDDAQLKSIAEEIVKECEGLPIALAIVGAALKDQKSLFVWRDALNRLRRRNPGDFIEKVYNPLKLSYDFLSSKEAKSLFLLCSLFPEDANIPLEFLAYFGLGLDIYEGITNLEELRDRVSALVMQLKGRSLLLDSENGDDHVTMHDIVRDVCISIAKQEGRVEGDNCSWISSFEQLPTRFISPNLNLLFLSCRKHYGRGEEAPKLDNTIFEGISDLRVLCIQNYRSLPPTHSLINITSLVLDSCRGLETISVVGEFEHLEILICRDCSKIEELPLEIKELVRLKLLELTGCRKLQRIGKGIISSLHALEELKMLGSFRRWESEDREKRKNAGIRELESLTNLRCLEIDIKDLAVASEMRLSSEIKKFHIRTGGRPEFRTNALGDRSEENPFNKTMVLDFKSKGTCVGNRTFEMELLNDTEVLYLIGNDASSVDLAKCQNIRRLELTDCETITLMVGVQASLERLKLDKLPVLEWICEGPTLSNSFDNLKELQLVKLPALKQLWKSSSGRPLFPNISSIKIEDCGSLCNLGELSIAGKDCLPQLEELVIKDCEMMEQVFLWNKEDEIRKDSESQNDHSIKKVFPKLVKVWLLNLPNLAFFYQGMGGFEFPLLTEMSIIKCPKLKGMGCSVDVDDKSSHLFCQPKVSFCNLKELKVDQNPLCGHEIHESLLNGLEVLNLSSLPGSTSLFSSSVAKNLGKLRVLNIRQCDEMLKVIEDNKEVVSGIAERPFPRLEELLLEDLPKLVAFCKWKCGVELHSLRKMVVKRCPDLKILSLGFLAAPKLVHLDSDFKNNLETEVSFDSLKKLEISWIEKPLYGHKFFDGLEELQVSECSMSCLFSSSTVRHFDNLEVLSIKLCFKMVKVIEDEENEEEKVGSGGGERTNLFPKLRKLELNCLPKLVSFCEWKCDNQLTSLRNLVIEHCPVLGIHTTVFKAAPYLENVEINLRDIAGDRDYFNSMLLQLEYMKYTARVKVLFNDLKYLFLHDQWNPFYGHQIPSSLFNGLENLTFSKLHGSTSLFSSSVAGNLVNLRRLKITNCDEMLKVIEDNKELMSSTAEMAHILFPKLEEFSLEELPKLVTFCEWKCNDELPSLRKVTIKGCPDMEIFGFSRVVAARNLEAFTTDLTHNLEIGVVDVSLDNLKKLVIRFRYSEQPLYGHKCFNGLKELQVSACSMSCLFTSSTARRLVNLEVLSIKFCYEMVKVIEDEEEEKMGSGGGERTNLFPKLKTLHLYDLPKLVSFCEWKCDIEFPSLRDVNIHMCPDLRIFTMGSIAAAPNLVDVKINNEDVGGDTNDMNSLAHENMVSFNSLKKLMIERSEKPLYGHKFFNGLKQLQVSACGMSCLFTSSTARRFDNLEVLSIKHCYEMVKVIEDEENEEKVGSGGGERTLLFPKLNKLELRSLPKLESFCEWKCDIEFPSLRNVDIRWCNVLRNFTMGSIAAAPKLEKVDINFQNIGSDTKDLNSVAQENMKLYARR